MAMIMFDENNSDQIDDVVDDVTSLIFDELSNLKRDVFELQKLREFNFLGSYSKPNPSVLNELKEKGELKDTRVYMFQKLSELHVDLSYEVEMWKEAFRENKSVPDVIDWVQMTSEADNTALMTSQTFTGDKIEDYDIPDAITMLAEQSPITVTICEAQNGEITEEKEMKLDEYEVEMVKDVVEMKEKRFQCNVCYKLFLNSSKLQSHIWSHKPDKPFQCKFCGKGYICKENYEDHVQLHLGEKSHKCGICEEEFTSRRNLTMHSKIHRTIDSLSDENSKSGIVRYCKVCGKSFTSNVALQTHLRVHTGEKPYECDICGKKFTSKAYVPIHRRQHTGQKPFTCEICGKAFNEKTNVVKHMRIHNGVKPYQCEICGKNFGTASHVKAHSRVHTGDRPYKCEICGNAYSKNQSLRMHMARLHPMESF